MRVRVGPFDLAAVVVVLVVLFLPPRELEIESAYARVAPDEVGALESRIAAAQAALGRDPGDGVAAEALAEALLATPVGQIDQARRVAAAAAAHTTSPTRWRALLARAWAEVAGYDFATALASAREALAACAAAPSACPAHERSRVEFFETQLATGVEAIARGVDPRADPAGFREMLRESTFRPARRPVRGQ